MMAQPGSRTFQARRALLRELAALSQARTLFPFPLLGIDTDSGSELLNERLIGDGEGGGPTMPRYV